jgi:hypothetical protein
MGYTARMNTTAATCMCETRMPAQEEEKKIEELDEGEIED